MTKNELQPIKFGKKNGACHRLQLVYCLRAKIITKIYCYTSLIISNENAVSSFEFKFPDEDTLGVIFS